VAGIVTGKATLMSQADRSLPPRLAHALESCRALHRLCVEASAGQDPPPEELERLIARLERLLELMNQASPDYEHQGRLVITTIQSQFPDLWPRVDRELLWFFGGDCLHYLGDEEIAAFQEREDLA